MAIGDLRQQDPSNQNQESFPNDTTPPTQDLDQYNLEEDAPKDQDQGESHDHGGDEDDGDKEEAPPHPRVCHNV
jgi:hypothetical protein